MALEQARAPTRCLFFWFPRPTVRCPVVQSHAWMKPIINRPLMKNSSPTRSKWIL
jgi:hypothetical protein